MPRQRHRRRLDDDAALRGRSRASVERAREVGGRRRAARWPSRGRTPLSYGAYVRSVPSRCGSARRGLECRTRPGEERKEKGVTPASVLRGRRRRPTVVDKDPSICCCHSRFAIPGRPSSTIRCSRGSLSTSHRRRRSLFFCLASTNPLSSPAYHQQPLDYYRLISSSPYVRTCLVANIHMSQSSPLIVQSLIRRRRLSLLNHHNSLCRAWRALTAQLVRSSARPSVRSRDAATRTTTDQVQVA